ncbi:roadblock/LC7 domain-containing protein [Deinococcus radiopugnans]|uniref:roadblock/LC7 domain-containing protein n=1 Tax=Deinococcus radiopugnans TaxID=57497 RepID=UPI00360DD166
MIAALLEVRGVRHALLVGHAGEVVAQAGVEEGQLSGDVGLVAAGRAVIGSLQSQMGSESWQEMVLDVDSGPVLLTPRRSGAADRLRRRVQPGPRAFCRAEVAGPDLTIRVSVRRTGEEPSISVSQAPATCWGF